MSTMDDLIEKLEKAEAGSRELDAEIMFDLYAKPVGKKEDGGPSGYLWPEDSPSWSFGIRFPGKNRAWFTSGRRDGKETLLIERDGALVLMNSLRVPRLTTSLDAAETLVPEGWDYIIERACGTAYAAVYKRGNSYDEDAMAWRTNDVGIANEISSPALALCIAAMKAWKIIRGSDTA